MSFNNHLIFSLSFCIFFIKYFNFNNLKIDIWHIIFSSLLSSLLPDIDHFKSFVGNKIIFISYSIYNFFGHRNITHSLIFVILLYLFLFNLVNLKFIPLDIKYGFILGYISHILSDMFTYRGVKLFWPFNIYIKLPLYLLFKNKKFEYYFCVIFFLLSLFLNSLLCILIIFIKKILKFK